MYTKTYTLSESGTYTSQALDSTATYESSEISNSVTYSEKTYPLTEDGVYTVYAIDSTGTYDNSDESNAVSYSAKTVDCFLTYNEGLEVLYLKISSDVSSDYNEVVSNYSKFTTDTNLLKDFSIPFSNIDASYSNYNSEESRGNFSIYRKEFGDTYYKYLTSIKDGSYSIYDYDIRSKSFYHYMATVEKTVTGSDPKYYNYESNFVDTDGNSKPFYFQPVLPYWSICDIQSTDDDYTYKKTGDVWTFGLGVSFESVTQNTGIIQNETLGQYGRISQTSKNYDSGSFSCLLGSIEQYTKYTFDNDSKDILGGYYTTSSYDGYTEKQLTYNSYYDTTKTPIYTQKSGWNITNPYATSIEKLQSWKKFIFDGNLKLLKSPKGEIWIISILSSPSSQIDYYGVNQHTTISFQWQEVVSADSVSIYGDTY